MWRVKRRSPYIPIIEAIGEARGNVSEKELLTNAVRIIEVSEKFNARLTGEIPTGKSISNISVCFCLIFQNNIDLMGFLRAMHSKGPTP